MTRNRIDASQFTPQEQIDEKTRTQAVLVAVMLLSAMCVVVIPAPRGYIGIVLLLAFAAMFGIAQMSKRRIRRQLKRN